MLGSARRLDALLLAAVLATALCAPGRLARAQEDAPLTVLEVEPLKERLSCPKEKPTLVVKAPHDGRLTVQVSRQPDGEPVKLSGTLKARTPFHLSWPLAGGEATYVAQVHIDYASGKTFDGVMGFSFVCAAPIDVKLGQGGLDLGRGVLKLDVVGPAVRAEMEVLAEGGGTLKSQTVKLRGGKGRKKLTLRWPISEDQPFGGLVLKIFDRHGAWVHLKLTPISVEIPHEEVVFENGKAVVRPSEEPKLEDTLAAIREEMERFVGDLTEPSLYIIGYTDTVGSKADNRRLSTARARSIGRWFRTHGLTNAILYQGFGEDVLAVETADSTPEPANRRAVYILTNFPPPVQPAMPSARWKTLR